MSPADADALIPQRVAEQQAYDSVARLMMGDRFASPRLDLDSACRRNFGTAFVGIKRCRRFVRGTEGAAALRGKTPSRLYDR